MDQTNVGNPTGYYGGQYSLEDIQKVGEMDADAMMGLMSTSAMDTSTLMGGQTLDEIINQNNKEMQRRRSSYHHSQTFPQTRLPHDQDPRRTSMLEFGGSANNSELEGFQFDPSAVQQNAGLPQPPNIAQRRVDNPNTRQRNSSDDLALNTQFHIGHGYSPITSASTYPHSGLNHTDSIGSLDMSPSYLSNSMLMGMDFSAGGLSRENSADMGGMNIFNQAHFSPNMTASPLQQDIPTSLRGSIQDPGGGGIDNNSEALLNKGPQLQMTDPISSLSIDIGQQSISRQDAGRPSQLQAPSSYSESSKPQPPPPPPPPPPSQPAAANLDVSNVGEISISENDGMGTQSVTPQYKNAYSSTGFDMLGVLMRVAARPKPQINIGAVDMSCAFVVCDVTQHDIPIVYCSDVFERLTGYTKHEILGRNCRFLQAPDGKIQAGVKRKYVDDQSVWRIKSMITGRQEMQTSVINYRKGGQPFMNLLTMIPIRWDSDEFKYYVGFQVDLVEQPASITNKNPGESILLFIHPYFSWSHKIQTDRTRSITNEVFYHGTFCRSMSLNKTRSLAKLLAETRFPQF